MVIFKTCFLKTTIRCLNITVRRNERSSSLLMLWRKWFSGFMIQALSFSAEPESFSALSPHKNSMFSSRFLLFCVNLPDKLALVHFRFGQPVSMRFYLPLGMVSTQPSPLFLLQSCSSWLWLQLLCRTVWPRRSSSHFLPSPGKYLHVFTLDPTTDIQTYRKLL